MKDAFGKEIQVGDTVVFNLSGYLAKGTVTESGVRSVVNPNNSQFPEAWRENYYEYRKALKDRKRWDEEYIVIEHSQGATKTANCAILAKM